MTGQILTVTIDGRRLETLSLPPRASGRPTIVMLHEGLGSISHWKDFPERLRARTGCGVLALELCGVHGANEALAGAAYLVGHPPRWGSQYFFYEVYYCPQALFQVGEESFRQYYPKLVTILLERQDPDGSWLSSDGGDRSGGRAYCTAMAVLALAVEYRYLPIYQR